MTQQTTENKDAYLSRPYAMVFAFASVVGAGIVVVPAAVLAETGSAAVVVWLATALLCVPMLVLFRGTLLRSGTRNDPLRDMVTAGLGATAGRMVPLCFVLVVAVGLPTNAFAGAQLLDRVIDLPVPPLAVAVTVLIIAIGTNLLSGRSSVRLQTWGSIVFFVVLVTCALVAGASMSETADLVPSVPDLATVPAGMLLAFWAFVGFENLTFVARDMRDPRRDFAVVSSLALAILVALALFLTVIVALRVDNVDPVTGVVDALSVGEFGTVTAALVAGAGVGAALLNSLSWVRGCGLVLEQASREGIIARGALVSQGATPRRGILAISACSTVTVAVLAIWPAAVVDLLAAACSVFVLIYVLCVLAYLRSRPSPLWAAANMLVLVLMFAMLISSGWRSVYGVVVFVVAALVAGPLYRRRALAPTASPDP